MTQQKIMQVVYSSDGLLHNPSMEITGGYVKKYLESPDRLSSIKNFIDAHPEFAVVDPSDYSLGPILDVHRDDYIEFLSTIYKDWTSHGLPREACLGDTFAQPSFIGKLDPEIVRKNAVQSPSGKMGYYLGDMSCNFVEDTWKATYASAQIALSAAHHLVNGESSVYALCRPPGHHSSEHMAAGYCFINNAAVVTRFLQNYTKQDMERAKQPYQFDFEKVHSRPLSKGTAQSKKKVLILDIDYHHGNGTQDIFYEDPSVFYISLHGSPDYPFFTGSVEEKGLGAGVGYNINIPLDPKTTTDTIYLKALEGVLSDPSVIDFKADVVVVSMGLDTWCEDPVGGMKLLQDMDTYKKIGALIKQSPSTTSRPVLFVQEGGYTVEKLGDLAGSVLKGFLEN